jgi:AraC-like DNA-binding protein
MSPRHFARAFAAETGCTPARFVERQRVTAAAELLLRTRWTQERIADRSGFGSVDALQRAFVRRHGVTPKAYREGAAAGVSDRESRA